MSNTKMAAMEKAHEDALGHFIGTIAEIQERLAELTAYADEHMGYSADEINYGHVGSAEHLLEQLTRLTDAAYKRGEYA